MIHKFNFFIFCILFLFGMMFINVISAWNFPSSTTTTATTTHITIIGNGTDSNESTRFNTLTGNCSASEQLFGHLEDGTRVCVPDVYYINDQSLNTTDSPSFSGLTLTGTLILNSLLNSQNITPLTDNLYNLGNSTHRFKNLYAVNIEATNIYSDYLNSSIIDAKNISSDSLNVSGYKIKDEGGNLVVVLK